MIAIGSDHGGFALKEAIKSYLTQYDIPFHDYGTYTLESCDYPDFAHHVCEAVTSDVCEKGILVCSTGVGISIAANKIHGIRAALCADCYSAKYTRLHNDANVLCMGGAVTGNGLALEITALFLDTPFSGDERHKRRIEKVTALEEER